MVSQLHQTIHHFFPDLYSYFEQIEDFRKKSEYELKELIVSALVMFLLKKGSRKAFNDELSRSFKRNYRKIFGLNPAHMDTVEDAFRKLNPKHMEDVKTKLIKLLIQKKILNKFRFLGKWFLVGIDGTHLYNVSEGHCEHCLTRKSKNGKITYFHNVLEAKIICSNGFSFSIETEFIENAEGDYEKQDCELKAFSRLADKLKAKFPKLPICILADGLYPNQTVFKICKNNHWGWIITLKEGNLGSIWKQTFEAYQKDLFYSKTEEVEQKNQKIKRIYGWANNLDYHGFKLHWFSCSEIIDEEINYFSWISSFSVSKENIIEIAKNGRFRWKIENEGFNIQKNHGYGLTHQFSRKSMNANKNYYQCMQIAHIINQLMELSSIFKQMRSQINVSLKHLKHILTSILGFIDIDPNLILYKKTCYHFD